MLAQIAAPGIDFSRGGLLLLHPGLAPKPVEDRYRDLEPKLVRAEQVLRVLADDAVVAKHADCREPLGANRCHLSLGSTKLLGHRAYVRPIGDRLRDCRFFIDRVHTRHLAE